MEWSVTEITLQDRYEITLNATFETDVPAPVVVAEPTSLNLPDLKAGDVLNGEFSLTNYDLVRADNVQVVLPSSDQYFRYELLTAIPTSLQAKQRITVPYRVISLKALESATTGDAGGGGCFSYQTCAGIPYNYICANGTQTGGSARYCWFRSYGSCGGVGGGGPNGW